MNKSIIKTLIALTLMFSLSPFPRQMVDELTGRLEKREAQLLAVSKDKARLEEECDNLKE